MVPVPPRRAETIVRKDVWSIHPLPVIVAAVAANPSDHALSSSTMVCEKFSSHLFGPAWIPSGAQFRPPSTIDQIDHHAVRRERETSGQRGPDFY